MCAQRKTPPSQDPPELLPFLPLVYVAWCDGVLTQDEIHYIQTRAVDASWLSAEGRDRLQDWLDPEDPPTPAELKELRSRIRRLAISTEGTEGPSLARLGVELARAAGDGDEPWCGQEALGALEEIEELVGVVGQEAARSLLGPDLPPEPSPDETPAPPPFDPPSMHAYLDGPWRETRQEVLGLLEAEEFRFPRDLSRAQYRARVLDAVQRLADQGYGLLSYPEACGGEGDAGKAMAVFETLAYGDLSVLVKFGVQFGLFGGSIHQLGTEKHHREYLERVGLLELPGCFAMTERGHGSNVRALETTATYLPETEEFEVHTPGPSARKDWIGNAALHGRMATVFARLRTGGEDHGVHAFLVPIRTDAGDPVPGVTIQDRGWKAGLNGVDNGLLQFDRVRIPRANLLDRFAAVSAAGEYESPISGTTRRFFTMLGTLVAGRISIAAASVSAARTALAIAVPYSDRRRQFGPEGRPEIPILDYRSQQRLLLPRLATTYGLVFAVRELVQRYLDRTDETQREVEGMAAGLKAYASWHAVDTIQACREACGGEGYAWDNRFGELRGDVDVFTTFEGANPVLLQLVARGLLAGYREEMGDLKLWDVVRYVAERAETRLTEMNPVATRRTEERHLRDPETHLAAFRYREERLMGSAARRLKDLIEDGRDSFDALNACQDHVIALATAHVERVILEAFQRGVRRAPNPGLSEVLRELAELYALATMERHRAWYLESGYMEPPKTRAIRSLVNRICGEVREQATFLVEGFGIPPGVLDAPAATRPV